MLYLASVSHQRLYQGIQKYVVIVLLNIQWIKLGDKIITNIICIVLWRIVYMVSIKAEIISKPPFQFSGPSLVILSVSINVGFGDTR